MKVIKSLENRGILLKETAVNLLIKKLLVKMENFSTFLSN